MPDAPERILTVIPLTRAERKVFDHIAMCRDSRRRLVQSSRQIAEATFLSHKSVQKAINRLNELRLIRTITGSPNRTSEHIFCQDTEPLVRGDFTPRKSPQSSVKPKTRSAAAGGDQ